VFGIELAGVVELVSDLLAEDLHLAHLGRTWTETQFSCVRHTAAKGIIPPNVPWTGLTCCSY